MNSKPSASAIAMNLADYYRALGLRESADFESVKGAYRRLARQYHPDINPGDEHAKERFIRITEAYREIVQVVHPSELSTSTGAVTKSDGAEAGRSQADQSESVEPLPKVRVNPDLSTEDQRLKQVFYEQLQTLFRQQRLPRAIALVEGLAQRIPRDPEVRQWQAITYQRWGRYLISQYQFSKAHIYLKKALATDPHNKSLWHEINRDLFQLDQTIAAFQAAAMEKSDQA